MRRYSLTGTPGTGKTAILRCLELDGYSVVEEAATDIMARGKRRASRNPGRMDRLSMRSSTCSASASCAPLASATTNSSSSNRSPICTYALASYLSYPISAALSTEIERIQQDEIYQKRVFFVQSLDFISKTDARRITPEDAMRFERVHEETYRRFDYQIVPISAAPLLERIALIKKAIDDTPDG